MSNKNAIIFLVATTLIIQCSCNVATNNSNEDEDPEPPMLVKMVEIVNKLIQAQLKSTVYFFKNALTSLTNMATELISKGVSLLNTGLTKTLENIAKYTKTAIIAGIDISVCSAKEKALYNIVTNLAIPMTECINTNIESCFEITYLIQSKVNTVLENAQKIVVHAFECEDTLCRLQKLSELTGLSISIPFEIGKLTFEAGKIIVRCNLDGLACTAKTGEEFYTNAEPVVKDILKCVDDKMKS